MFPPNRSSIDRGPLVDLAAIARRLARIEALLERMVPVEVREAEAYDAWVKNINKFGLKTTDFDLTQKPWLD
jgi:hypothetical protein